MNRQSLRMNNRFPTLKVRDSRPHNPGNDTKDLKFGGVLYGGGNPGADILRRSAESAERTYASYDDPKITAGEMLQLANIKPNEQFPHFGDTIDMDKELAREVKRTNIEATKQRINQGNRRLDIAEFKKNNPNLKFIPVKGGNIMAFNPQTGDSEDTGIATNTLSESERIRITQENAMKKQDDAQDAAANKPPTPSQQTHAITNRIREAISRNPAWRDFIDEETGVVAPVGAGSSFFGGNKGLDEATRNTIIDTIFGSGRPSNSTPSNTPQNTPSNATPTNVTPNQPNQPVQRIRIQMPNGTKGMWRADKPLPEGAVRIQ